MSYTKYHWATLAQDYNSPLLRNYIWVGSTYLYWSMHAIPNPKIAIVSRNSNIHYLYDKAVWDRTHEAAVAKAEADFRWLGRVMKETMQFGKETNAWTQKHFGDANLRNATPEKLIALLEGFAERQRTLYAYGVLLPVLDFGNYSFVERNLKDVLSRKIAKHDIARYYHILTEPRFFSFAQEQEVALLKLMVKYYSPKWKRAVLARDYGRLQDIEPAFCAALRKHAKKYAWVYYVYMGPAFGPEQYLDFVREHLRSGIVPTKILNAVVQKKEQTERERKKCIASIDASPFEKEILRLAGIMVWAKPRRKDYQSKSYYHAETLMREIGRRTHLSLDQARSTPFAELKKAMLEKRAADADLANSCKDFHVCLPNDNGTITILAGSEAAKFGQKFTVREWLSRKKIFGSTAYPGKAQGTVRVINAAQDIHKMKHGDILVSVATTPAIVSAMKKAAAIVSDEGGLTCHASIVSRELEIPCVVGTGVATQSLKDGDTVEVDASKGTVTKL